MPADADRLSMSAAEDPRVAEVLQEYLSQLEAGGCPDRSALLARYPELAPTLSEAMDGLDFLHSAVGSWPSSSIKSSSILERSSAPALLGDFRILREVGRGGMGVVYEAEQMSLGRRVALKVLPFAGALDSRQLMRFKNEAQAAAQLHHTNIVPVFAVGCDRGVHYYAMQFIDGQTLADVSRAPRASLPSPPFGGRGEGSAAAVTACDSTQPRAALTTSLPRSGPAYYKALARLGVQAAEALDYAHQMGVVHRDVKPANLLIDARGTLWVTDFGLAQFHGGADLTLSGDVLGTVRYMSPEQAEGRRGRVDHHSDIYSLGLSLYELFTRRYPYPARDRAGLLREILTAEPQPPRRFRRDLPVELETVVLKAMAKHPAERYATSQELANDLRRFIDDKPVLARRPTLVQVVGKWARRHRAVVRAVAVVLAIGFVGLAAAATLLYRAHQQTYAALVQASVERAEARRAVDEMYKEFAEKVLANDPGRMKVQREFLERALGFYERFAVAAGDSAAARFEKARAWLRTGDIRQKLGDMPAAKHAYDEAFGLLDGLLKEAPDSVDNREALAGYFNGFGAWCINTGQPAEAAEKFRRAVALRRQLVAESPADPKQRVKLAGHLSNLGAVYLGIMEYDQALQSFNDALAELEQCPETNGGEPTEARGQLATTYHNLGIAYHRTDRPAEAEKNWEQSQAIVRELAKARPFDMEFQYELASGALRMGVLCYDVGRLAESERHLREARDTSQKLFAQFPQVPAYRDQFARSAHAQARTLRALGRSDDAKEALEQGEAVLAPLARELPQTVAYSVELLQLRIDLANLLTESGQPVSADEVSRRAWADTAEWPNQLCELPEAKLHRLKLRNNMAFHAHGAGRLGDAEPWYRDAVKIGEELIHKWPNVPEFRSHLVGVYTNLGDLLTLHKRFGEAQKAFTMALALMDRLAADDSRPARWQGRRAWGHVRLAQLYDRQGSPEEARKFYDAAGAIVRDTVSRFPDDQEARLYGAWFLASCPDPASRDMDLALELANRAGQKEPNNGEVWRAIGLVQLRKSDGPAAVASLLKGRQQFHGRDRVTDLLLAMAYAQSGDSVLARQEYDQACQRIANAHEHGEELDRFRDEANRLFRAGG